VPSGLTAALGPAAVPHAVRIESRTAARAMRTGE